MREESYIYIRPKFEHVSAPSHVAKVYPNNSAIAVAYRFLPEDSDGKWISIGVAFCSPKEKHWEKRKARSISKSRLDKSPLRLQYEGLEASLTTRHVLTGLRAVVFEKPTWKYIDDQVLRPKRFTQRWGAPLVGPDGSLLHAYFDFKHVHRDTPREYARLPPPVSHWILNAPDWAQALLEE